MEYYFKRSELCAKASLIASILCHLKIMSSGPHAIIILTSLVDLITLLLIIYDTLVIAEHL